MGVVWGAVLCVCAGALTRLLCPSVITELDGLAKGQDGFGGGGNYGNGAHVRAVQEKARQAVAFLERGFEAREPGLRALTSRGNQLESIAFRSEDTSGQQVGGGARAGAGPGGTVFVFICWICHYR